MKKVSFFAAAAAVTALVATPALAQDNTAKPRSSMQGKADKSKQAKPMKHSSKQAKPMRHSARMQSRDAGYMRAAAPERTEIRRDARADWNNRGWDNRRSGFWPADVVGGAIGTAGAVATTAVGTAGAIATAPFGGPYRNTYAYGGPEYAAYDYKGVAIPYSSNYAARNGFVCEPGTFIKGTRTLCQ